ncbi:MAG: heme ABC exporter ATP-binding protein CcmA [Kiloniellales bacterium]
MSVFAGDNLACVRGERMVFCGLDFHLEAGAALVLLGPNGSGKSSLLRLMAGLLRPAAGRLAWDGAGLEEDREAHAGRLHYVGHLDAVKPVLSVAENLAFWAGLRAPPAGAGQRVEAALARFGLTSLAGLPARFLSAGQRRRLALARIAATPAPLWLLDEPTAALDDASVARLTEVIAGHRAGGGMVVVATHGGLDLPGAAALALDRFAALDSEAAT